MRYMNIFEFRVWGKIESCKSVFNFIQLYTEHFLRQVRTLFLSLRFSLDTSLFLEDSIFLFHFL